LRSSFGDQHFTRLGEVLGQHQFLLHKHHTVSPYVFQPSYYAGARERSSPSKAELEVLEVPTAQVGIQDLRVREINVENETFHADFYYWVRVPQIESAPPQEIPDSDSDTLLRVLDFRPDTSGNKERLGEQRLISKNTVGYFHQRLYYVSGTFRFPPHSVSPRFSLENISALFPFDSHNLKIELEAVTSDSNLHLSPGTRNLEPIGRGDTPEADGWSVSDSYVATSSRETNAIPIPFPFETDTQLTSNYDEIVISFSVHRQFWNMVALIWVPLLLLTSASLAVLYITFGEAAADMPEQVNGGGQENKGAQFLDTLKTQTELSLGCALAVITYLISYSTLAVRLDAPSYADVLVGFALVFTVFNFIFLVAISRRTNTRFFAALTAERYLWWATRIALCVICGWLVLGLVLYSVGT
jgi:hypothetical protein